MLVVDWSAQPVESNDLVTRLGECLPMRNVTVLRQSPVVWNQVSYMANHNGVAYPDCNFGAVCVWAGQH